jgi:chemotaxis protein MotB
VQLPEDEVKPGAPEWVVTFGDMMSLLLTFFVLLLSFSTMEAQKFKMISGYMRQAFGLQTKESYTGIPMGTTILSTDARTTTNPAQELQLIQAIRRQLEEAGMTRHASVHMTERGVSVQLNGEVMFASGRSDLKPEVHEVLDGIARIATDRSGIVEIEGHTDDVPIASSRYPSNWELSSARAGSTARYLIQQGVPGSRVKAVGYADTRPVVPNTSAEGRSKNRRVEFVFVRHGDNGGPQASSSVAPTADESPEATP